MVKKYGDLYGEARKAFMTQEDGEIASFWARNLLCHITGKSYAQLISQREMYAGEQTCEEMEQAVNRVLGGEPLAYVLGQWEFFGLPLVITPDVLIPRDDTCAVVELAIKHALFLESGPRILDLCCGSGCIGLAISSRIKDAKVTCGDLSKEALAITKKNIALNKMSGRVSSLQMDALGQPAAFLGKFDMIVSNPPYITTREMTELPDSVKDHEPHMALHGGTDGLDFYRNISASFCKALKPGGFLCFEFGMDQGDSVCRILQENGFTVLERSKDYNERERAVIARYDRKD